MATCEICFRKARSGNLVSHSHRKTKRKFKPNIHSKTIYLKGQKIKIKICTNCLKNNFRNLA